MTTKISTLQKITFTLLFALCGIALSAQDTESKKPEIKNLDFMKGTWEGSGWKMMKTGKEYSDIVEKVQCKLDCSMFIVDGLGTKIDSATLQKKTVHEAFGVIYFDKPQSKWMMRAHTKYGAADSEIEFLGDKKIGWKLVLPDNSIIKYTTDFSTEGKWLEKGEMTKDGKSWFQIMEISLTRK